MTTRVATIDDEARAAIRALIARAQDTRVPVETTRLIQAGRRPPVGDDPAHCLTISGVYRCVFSVEEHPGGWMRHLSVSIVDPNPARPLPSPEAISALAAEFGFSRDPVREGAAWIEDGRAINVVEKLEGSDG